MKFSFINLKSPKLRRALVIGAVFIFVFGVSREARAEEFFVETSYQPEGLAKINAGLEYTSGHAYFFVEDNWYHTLDLSQRQQAEEALTNLAREFEETIYPQETRVFGQEWTPGIDNDVRITILVSEMIAAPGGYFNPNDEYPRTQLSHSNEREMVYLNALYLTDSKAPAFLAHEFQHLITFNQKNRLRGVDDEVWLNEARAEYASTLCGYNDVYEGSNLARRVEHYLAQPTDSLTHWQNDAYDYGSVGLFIHYLVDHYTEKILTQMLQNDKIGKESINWALSSLGYVERFEDVFSRWLIANLINNCEVGLDQEYCYLNSNLNYQNLHIEFAAAAGPAVSLVELTKMAQNWSGNWQRFTAKPRLSGRFLKIEFSANGTSDFAVFYVATQKDGQPRVMGFGLSNGQGVVNVNNFGTIIEQIDILVMRQPAIDDSSSISLQSFTLRAATYDGVYGPLADDTLVVAGDSRVYLIKDGQKQWLSSTTVFESYYQWSMIKPASEQDLSGYQETGAIRQLAEGLLVKTSSSERVYVISAGRRRWLASAQVFETLDYQWSQIKIVSEADLNQHSLGKSIASADLHPEGSLLKGSSPLIYYLQNNKKRPIASLEIFEHHYFKWERVLQITDSELDKYPLGTPLS